MSEEDHQGPLPRAALFITEDSALVDERTLEGYGTTAMVGAMVGADHQFIELFDISAALSVDQSVSLAAARYAIASVSPASSSAPSFDGVIEGGRSGSSTRPLSSRTSGPVSIFADAPPDLPASAFVPGILALGQKDHPGLSQFRLLKIKVEGFMEKLQYRSIALTSSRAGEGRTTTALNLALVMSENPWLKIVLLDLNLRKPDLGRLMRVGDGDPGLLHVLSGRVTLDVALKKVENRNLYVLHTGGLYEASLEVLNSPQFDVFLNRLHESFDLVIIDAPPVLGTDDTLIIKQKVDGLFFVMRAESTPIEEVHRAVMRVGRDRVLGIILNQVQPDEIP